MRRITFFILILCLYSGNIFSQEGRVWMDAGIEHNIFLNKWTNSEIINNSLGSISTLGFKGRLHLLVDKRLGIFAELGVPIYLNKDKQNKLTDTYRKNDKNYYLIRDHSGKSTSDGGTNIMIGAFYKLNYNKWNIVPYLGIGYDILNVRYSWLTYKEENSNNMYYLTFDNDQYDLIGITFLSLQTNVSYRLSKKLSLIFGMNYRIYPARTNWDVIVRDYHSFKRIETYQVKGNVLQSVGFNAGIAF